MGYYINNVDGKQLPAKGKAQFLIDNANATITQPNEFKENLVCVVENYSFDAAAYAFSKEEMNEFKHDDSGRKKTWLIVPNAEKLSK